MTEDDAFEELPEREPAWAVLDKATAYRKRLLAAGYQPLPVNGKIVKLEDWPNIAVTDAIINAWAQDWPDHLSTGLLTRHTPVVDIDITDEGAAEELEALVEKMLGKSAVRIGRAPKRAIFFRTDTPFCKRERKYVAPNGNKHQIEILGDGQQVVVNGIHPDTKQHYRWHGGEPGPQLKHGDLPSLTPDQADAFLAAATELLQERGWKIDEDEKRKRKGKSKAGTNGKGDKNTGTIRERAYATTALDNLTDELAATKEPGRNIKLYKCSFRLGTMAVRGWLTREEIETSLYGAALACGLVEDDGEAQTRSSIESGLDDGAGAPHPGLDDEGEEDADADADAGTDNSTALPFLNISAWENQPVPEQEWAVLDRIPLRQVALFSGEGAAGKSTLQLQLSAATVLGRDWIGSLPEPGPSIFIDAEDDENVLHRRTAAIAAHYSVSFAELARNGLHLNAFAGEDTVLAAPSRSGKIEPTGFYKRVLQAAGDIKPKMIGIASSANVYAGSEIDRSQVQQFIGLLTKIAIVANGSIQLISHPSLTGISTDTGLSGNTQWHNAVRARSYLKGIKPEAGEQADNDLRELVFKKNNYGPISESIVLRWQNGLFLPLPGMASLDRAAHEAKADEVFLDLLRRFTAENRNASDKKGPSYAPALFAREDEAKRAGLTNRSFEDAMRRLFKTGKIWNEPYGKASRQHYRLARKS